MGVIVVEHIDDEQIVDSIVTSVSVAESIHTTDTVSEVTNSVKVVEVVRPGGTVANVLWGYGLPSNPTVGMIFIDVS